MDGQMSIFDFFEHFNPLREVAKIASPYWTSSCQTLMNLCNTDPDISIWTKTVKHEYCPYGLSGHYCDLNKPNTLKRYDMMTNLITVEYYDSRGDKQERAFSWADFAREIADMIWRGEWGEA